MVDLERPPVSPRLAPVSPIQAGNIRNPLHRRMFCQPVSEAEKPCEEDLRSRCTATASALHQRDKWKSRSTGSGNQLQVLPQRRDLGPI